MCEFCENIGIGMPSYTFGDDELPTYKNSSGEFIELRKIGNKIFLVFSNSADEYGYGAINVNHCPMCGRKLTEGQPAFEVIYALSSYREMIRTINNLATKLKQRGIDDFEIHEGVQIKSDKFIISAVDVWGAVTSKDYKLVKYYIDKVSDKDYSSAQGKENTLLRLKLLKYGFRDGVKEISEEELLRQYRCFEQGYITPDDLKQIIRDETGMEVSGNE